MPTTHPMPGWCDGSIRFAAALFGALALAACKSSSPAPAALPQDPGIDLIFADYNKTDSPGCALAIVEHGAIVYSRGYGLASLEHQVPITPKTVFDIGSTSKQFAAFGLLLLQQEGKLSLDDDVRTHVPELPALGGRITLRHLLTHTSGLRDYTDLMAIEGFDLEEVTGRAEPLAALARQRGLNFAPGTEWSYSNSGFFLAALVIERVSGQSMRAFAKTRIFEPLGMASTHYFDDHTEVIARRAAAYGPRRPAGFRIDMSNWEQTGDGAIQTTVEDLAKWDQNFYDGRVGGASLLAELQTPGRLDDGTALDYALGLRIDSFRGAARVSHGGAWGGYRAELMRFPDQRRSVIVLCNLATTRPTDLAERVAIARGGAAFGGAPQQPRIKATSEELARAVGVYWNARWGALLRIEPREGGIAVAGTTPVMLHALGEGRYVRDDTGEVLRVVTTADGAMSIETGEGTARLVYARMEPAAEAGGGLPQYAGRYTSDELAAQWTVTVGREGLIVTPRRGPAMTLTPAFRDAFRSDAGVLRFIRNERGAVEAIAVTTRGLRDVRLVRADAE